MNGLEAIGVITLTIVGIAAVAGVVWLVMQVIGHGQDLEELFDGAEDQTKKWFDVEMSLYRIQRDLSKLDARLSKLDGANDKEEEEEEEQS